MAEKMTKTNGQGRRFEGTQVPAPDPRDKEASSKPMIDAAMPKIGKVGRTPDKPLYQ